MCGIVFQENVKVEEMKEYMEEINNTKYRGPDKSDVKVIYKVKGVNLMGFHRLAIHGLSDIGDQPMTKGRSNLVCNGEIYNYMELSKIYSNSDYKNKSDCEIILEMYVRSREKGINYENFCNKLDGEFAFVIDDEDRGTFACRDPYGVRPLYYGYTDEGNINFASELKNIRKWCKNVKPFPPGHYYINNKFYKYKKDKVAFDIAKKSYSECTIKALLESAVMKRLSSERPIGFFLSGGLDSSLIAGIGTKLMKRRITTFSIGTDASSPDLMYANKVAKHINSWHHQILFTPEEGLEAITNVIYHLESYDCTTIRASVPMYLMSKYVKDNTDIRVILSGEGADELFGGYLYLHNAPNEEEFHNEIQNLMDNISNYDVLRADRCTSGNGLELRVPFLDKDLVEYVNMIDPKHKRTEIEKLILRDAFDEDIIPEEVLYRQKNGMSDAVGYSWVNFMREYAEHFVKDWNPDKYAINTPVSKEEYMYREIYTSFFGNTEFLTHIWRPKYTSIKDPSATLLNVFKK